MIVYGKQPVIYLCQKCPEKIIQLMVAKELEQQSFQQLSRTNKKIIRVDSKKAQALARGGNHQGYLAEIEPLTIMSLKNLKNVNHVLVLNNVTDIGNIGAMTRTAYALGFEALLLCGTLPSLDGAVRTSAGAILDMPVAFEKNIYDAINELRQNNFCLIGSDAKEKPSQNEANLNKTALFMGNEGEGLSHKILQKMDIVASITMKQEFDSLNVASAAAILMDRILNGRI